MRIQCRHDALVPIDSLRPFAKNRNQHTPEQIARLAKLLEYQGIRSPIVLAKPPFDCIAKGHGTVEAIRLNGWKEVPVVYQDFDDEEQLYAYVQSDNAIQGWAELDLAGINSDIGDLGPDFDIDMLGIRDFTVDVAEKHVGDPDAVPETPKEAKTKRGELWTLGEHRVLCGDATSREDVERLMAGEKADMVFTDPPYNVGFKYNEHDDTAKPYIEWKATCEAWLKEWLSIADRIVLTPGCNNLELWCRISNPTHIACWVKENANTTGRVTHLWQWEPIVFIGKFERRRASDVFVHHVDSGFLRDPTTGCHPCPKPLRLWEDLVDNFAGKTSILFEPFCGSGTTVIAAEKTGRRAFATEIDAIYCDVILTRWAKFTGRDPVREDGKRWSELNA